MSENLNNYGVPGIEFSISYKDFEFLVENCRGTVKIYPPFPRNIGVSPYPLRYSVPEDASRAKGLVLDILTSPRMWSSREPFSIVEFMVGGSLLVCSVTAYQEEEND